MSQLPPGFVLDTQPAVPQAGAQRIYGAAEAPPQADPRKVFEDERDYDTARGDKFFEQTSKLRDEFNNFDFVKEYPTVARQYSFALQTPEDASGDQALITAYAKMLDPGSVVREQEFDTTAAADSAIGRMVSKVKRDLGIEGGGRLSPEAREKVRSSMRTLVQQYDRQYQDARKRYGDLADTYGFDPNIVVGQDYSETYADTINAYWKSVEEKQNGGGVAAAEDEGLPVTVTYEGPNQFKNDTFGAFGSALDKVGTLGKQGITLGLSDEASGIGGGIAALLKGDSFSQGYTNARDRERENIAAARDELGAFGTALEVLGGGGGVVGKAGQVMSAGRSVAAAGQPINRATVQNALVGSATRTGAGLGALGGFGYGEGAGGSAVNALGGLALGGAVGRFGQQAGNAISNRAGGAFDPMRAQAIANAGEAEGVTVNRAMIDPRQSNTFSGVETTGSGPRLNREMNRIEGQVEDRVQSLGGGRTPEREFVGEAAQRGATRTYSEGGQRAGRLYDKADQAAGGTVVRPANALAEIDAQIADLTASGANANRGLIGYLEDLKGDLANGMTIRGLRDQRTAMRGQINERNLGMTDAERRVSRVMDAASQDIEAGLANNPAALNLYRRADGIWKERSQFRQEVLRSLRGPENNPLSGEKALAKIESWMRDDAGRFSRMWKALDTEEQADLRAQVAQSLGRNSKGEFSPAFFLTHTGDAKGRAASDRALRMIFGDEGMQSIKNLRTLSEELNRLGSLRNRSNTERARGYKQWLGDALLGGGGVGLGTGVVAGSGTAGAAAAVGTAAAVGGIQTARNALTANMLLNPKITRWIAQAPQTANPRAIDAHFAKLGDIAKAEPALAGEIETLRRAVLGAANDNAPAGLAAEEQDSKEVR